MSKSGSCVESKSCKESGLQSLDAPLILKPLSSISDPDNAWIRGLVIEIGRSDHHRFQGGGTAVPNASDILFDCCQVKSISLRKRYHSRFRHSLSRASSPPRFIAPLNGSPLGRVSSPTPIISAKVETF